MSNSQTKNSNNQIGWKFVKQIIEFSSPVLYALFWLLLLIGASEWLPEQITSDKQFLPIFTIVFLFALASKTTLWSIGHEKFGIKGDSRSKIINYHRGENGEKSVWFDLFADNPDLLRDKDIRDLIKDLKDNK